MKIRNINLLLTFSVGHLEVHHSINIRVIGVPMKDKKKILLFDYFYVTTECPRYRWKDGRIITSKIWIDIIFPRKKNHSRYFEGQIYHICSAENKKFNQKSILGINARQCNPSTLSIRFSILSSLNQLMLSRKTKK